jgi:hypothetical protein
MVSRFDFRSQHARYRESSLKIKDAVDVAFDSVVQSLRSCGLRPSMGDEAEELVAAIHHYYERSRDSSDPVPHHFFYHDSSDPLHHDV